MIELGGQSQRFNQVSNFLSHYKPAIWKAIDPGNEEIRAWHAVSPDTKLIVRMFTGAEEYKDAGRHPDAGAYGAEYAQRLYDHWRGVHDIVYAYELENEQTVFNLADVARWNAFTIGAVVRANALGIRIAVGNFPEGHPEVFKPNSYELDPALWLAMVPALRQVKAGGHLLGLHEYGCPTMQQDWNSELRLGFRCGRHRAVLNALPADLRDIKILIGECGIDWLIRGVEGGYAHAGGTIEAFVEQLAWYQGICAPNVVGCCVFGAGLFGGAGVDNYGGDPGALRREKLAAYARCYPAAFARRAGVQSVNWTEYDCFRDDHDFEVFGAAVQAETAPPQGGSMSTAFERVNAAWKSQNIAFNPDAAFFKFAQEHGLGRPVANEYRYVNAQGQQMAGQGFDRAFVECVNGKWGELAAYDWLTGEPWTAAAPGVPPPGAALPYTFPQALEGIGAVGEEGSPIAGAPFYRLVGANVTRGVSAFMVVTVYGKRGVPLAGVQVVNLFPDGKGEVVTTDGAGAARFQFGPSSAFTNPGEGPFTIFVAEGAEKNDDSKEVSWKRKLSDTVKSLGDFQATHTEIGIQFVEQP